MSLASRRFGAYNNDDGDDVDAEGDFAPVWAAALAEAEQEANAYDRALAYRWLDDVTDAVVDPNGFVVDDDAQPDEWKWHADGYRSGDEDADDFDEDVDDRVGYVVDDWEQIEPDRPVSFVIGPAAAGARPHKARVVALLDPGDPDRGVPRRWAAWPSNGDAAVPTGRPAAVLSDDQVADAIAKRLRAGSDVRPHNGAKHKKRAVAGRAARFLLDAAPRPWQTYSLGLADALLDASASGFGSASDATPWSGTLRAPLDDPDARLAAAARVVLARDALYNGARDIDRNARAAERVGIVKGWLAAVRNIDPDIDGVLVHR